MKVPLSIDPSLPPLAEMPDDFALTLDEACRLFFRGKIKPDSLRALHARGELAVQRVGRRDWVTAGAVRKFLRAPPRREMRTDDSYLSTRQSEHDSSPTDRSLAAQAAAKAAARMLRSGSAKAAPPAAAVNITKLRSKRSRAQAPDDPEHERQLATARAAARALRDGISTLDATKASE